MDRVTVKDLRNNADEIVDRAAAGHGITVTKRGRPVAELIPVRTRRLSATELLERWRHVPVVDGRAMRCDMDRVTSPRL